MLFATKHKKGLKFKGVWKHYDTRHFICPHPPHTHSWEKHCRQWFKRKEEIRGKKKEEEKGIRKAQNLLRSVRGTLEVKVLHHVPKHLVVFFGHVISPLDIIP